MRGGRPFLSLLFLAVFFFDPSVTNAGEVEAASKVREVTVFPDRAMVSRAAKVSLQPGATTVLVQGLPTSLVDGSLRVSCDSDAPIRIGSVDLSPVYKTDLVREDEKRLAQTAQELNDRKRALEDRVRVLQIRLQFIDAVRREATATAKEEIQRNRMDPESWKEAWLTLEEGSLDAYKAIQAVENEKRDLQVETDRVTKELAQIASGRKQENVAKIHLEASSSKNVELILRYVVTDASWRPQYDARLESAKETLSLDQLAEIQQNTGEDWLGIRLTLSTARPAEGMRAPVLSEWVILSPQRAAEEARKRADKDSKIQQEGSSNVFVLNGLDTTRSAENILYLAPSAVSGEEVVAAMPEPAAQVVSGEFLAEYQIHGEVDVPSDNLGHKYVVLQHKMEVKLAARVVPKLMPRAFLLAHGVYKGAAPLLPGPLALYRDSAFVGNDRLEMLRPGGEADFPLGIDDKLLVSYAKEPDQRGDKGFLSKSNRFERWYEIKLANRHSRAMEITVVDQIPVSEDARIKVELAKDSRTPTVRDYEKKRGLFSWAFDLKPEEEIAFRFGYTVAAPEGVRVQGL